jgi:hypothetical protein
MIDTGAEGYAFIVTLFAQHHVFPICPVIKPKTLYRFSGHADGHLGNYVIAAKLQVGIIFKKFKAQFLLPRLALTLS